MALRDVTNVGGGVIASGSAKKARRPTQVYTCQSFAITLRCNNSRIDREVLAALSPDFSECCISLEKGKLRDKCEFHLHAYFKFVGKFSYEDLIRLYSRKLIKFGYNDITVHVEKVKKLRTYLSYITKEDLFPFHCGVNENYFSFRYRAYYALRELKEWDCSHPFVVEHRFCYKFLHQFWIEITNSYSPFTIYIWPCILYDVKWFLDLYDWYVNFVSTVHYRKKKHCYLFGPSNVGKTTAVEYILRDLGNRVYRAADQHPFGGYNSNVHRCIIFEEFRCSKFDFTILNKCLEGSEFYCNQKYMPERVDRCIFPVIFISNFPPPNSDHFRNRVIIIEANEALFDFQELLDIPTAQSSVIIEEDIKDGFLSSSSVSSLQT